jgi:hypothetical protein
MNELLKSISNLFVDTIPSTAPVFAVIVSIITLFYFWYSNRISRLNPRELEIFQNILDELLRDNEFGNDARVTMMIREGQQLKPVLFRTSKVDSRLVDPSQSKEMGEVAHLAADKQSIFTTSANLRPQKSGSEQLREIMAIPLIGDDGTTQAVIVVDSSTAFSSDRQKLLDAMQSIARTSSWKLAVK